MNPLILPILDIAKTLIGKLIQDPQERAKAEMELLQMQQQGQLRDLEIRMSAIVMEAQSQDPWTSRARPSFMYVMYLMILTAIPMGILHAFNPEISISVAEGMKAWLAAIPEELWWLFGAGYLGYTGSRMFEKVKRSTK